MPVPVSGKSRNINSVSWFLSNNNWKNNDLIQLQDKSRNVPCFRSNACPAVLKKWLRSLTGKNLGDVYLRCPGPYLCDNAAHLERSRKKKLLHWDLSAIMDFWLWGNKLFKNSESKLYLAVDEESVVNELPSMKTMRCK